MEQNLQNLQNNEMVKGKPANRRLPSASQLASRRYKKEVLMVLTVL
jgi:hypothetical protein